MSTKEKMNKNGQCVHRVNIGVAGVLHNMYVLQ